MSSSSRWSSEQFERARLELFARHGFEARVCRIAHADHGDTYALVREGPGTPLLLIHGGLAEASNWYSCAAMFEGKVVIPDRPGCGLSHAMNYRGVDYRRAAAEWLLTLANGLGAERVDVVGNSMGGYFAMAFALAYPERVRRLILIGAPAGLDRPLPWFLRLRGRPGIGHFLGALEMTDPEVARKRIFGPMMTHPERHDVRAIEVGLANARFESSKVCVHTMLANVSDLGGWRRELLLREAMTKLPVPTLFVWGDDDNFAPPSSGEMLARRMPDARTVRVAETGHLAHLDAPAPVAHEVRQFVQETR